MLQTTSHPPTSCFTTCRPTTYMLILRSLVKTKTPLKTNPSLPTIFVTILFFFVLSPPPTPTTISLLPLASIISPTTHLATTCVTHCHHHHSPPRPTPLSSCSAANTPAHFISSQPSRAVLLLPSSFIIPSSPFHLITPPNHHPLPTGSSYQCVALLSAVSSYIHDATALE